MMEKQENALPCYDEKSLERFVLNDDFVPGEAEAIQHHVAACPHCAEGVNTLRQFYATAHAVVEPTLDRVEKAVMQRLDGRPHVHAMRPLQALRGRKTAFKLAADTALTAQRYETLQTYASPSDNLLARLVRDHRDNQTALYIISGREDDPLEYRMDFGRGEAPRLSDAQGRIDLSDLDPAALDALQFTLKSPLASFELLPFESIRDELIHAGQYILGQSPDQLLIELASAQGQKMIKLSLRLQPESGDVCSLQLMLTRRALPPSTLSVQGCEVLLQENALEGVLSIKVFEGA